MAQNKDPIEHVVVLMLENRSFDQMLGDFQRIYPNLDGIDPKAPRRTNVADGKTYEQLPTTVRRNSNDPDHQLASVLRQIGANATVKGSDCRRSILIRLPVAFIRIVCSWGRWLWHKIFGPAAPPERPVAKALRAYEGHFVAEYVRKFPDSTAAERDEVMGYYEIDRLPALHFLARHFTVCDRWYSSVPGPTWANRFFVHTGTARGIARMPDNQWDFKGYALYDQRTIYDELNDHDKEWRIYFHDVPQTLALSNQWQSENKRKYSPIENFEADAAGPASQFPAFVFIEPQYNGDDANDDHPPYDIMQGQALTARVYNAIRANENLWQSTLLVIVYDEHGGFYDHVEPRDARAPDKCALEYSFDRLGVRVPAVLVSPWVRAGDFPADKNIVFDHTSIGKYLCERWGLKPLGNRMKEANSIGLALRLGHPPNRNAPLKAPALPEAQATQLSSPNENQIALNALSEHLEEMATGVPQPPRRKMSMSTKPDPAVIRSRVLGFLKQPS
jgi:phospholipase C